MTDIKAMGTEVLMAVIPNQIMAVRAEKTGMYRRKNRPRGGRITTVRNTDRLNTARNNEVQKQKSFIN